MHAEKVRNPFFGNIRKAQAPAADLFSKNPIFPDEIFDVMLLPRRYTIDVGMHHENGATADMVCRCLDFDVLRVAESGADHYPWPRTRGYVRVDGRWRLTAAGGQT